MLLMKKRKLLYGTLLAVAAVAIAGGMVSWFWKAHDEQTAKIQQNKPIPVEVMTASYHEDLSNELAITGKTVAYETLPVKANTTGMIKKINFT